MAMYEKLSSMALKQILRECIWVMSLTNLAMTLEKLWSTDYLVNKKLQYLSKTFNPICTGNIASFSFPIRTGHKGMKFQQFVLTQGAEVIAWAIQLYIAELPPGRKFLHFPRYIAASCKRFSGWKEGIGGTTLSYEPWLKHFSEILVNDNRRQSCGSLQPERY